MAGCGWQQRPPVTAPADPAPVAGHQVRPGDTLSEIAMVYGSSVGELAQLNGLAPPYLIRVGETLALPVRQPAVGVAAASEAPRAAAAPRATAVTSQSPAPAPATGAPRTLTTAALPPGDPVADTRTSAASPETVAGSVAPQPPRRPEASEPATTPVALPGPVPDPAAAGTAPSDGGHAGPPRFAWPVPGEIVERFGGENFGIDIAAERGTVVRASAGGTVAYADDELRGFGNLILIRHAGDWVTAYAHLDQILVRLGEEVSGGSIIGTVGSTGSDRTALHFEIREGRDPVDPMTRLPPL